MENPVAIITGASGGIGGATAQVLAREGYRLALNGLEAETLTRFAAELEAGGAETVCLPGDVTAAGFPDEMCKLALDRFGRIDALVGGAGTSRPAGFHEIDDDEWAQLVNVNLSAAFRLARQVGKHMMDRGGGGAIVEIASISYANGGGNVAYGAAKAGVVAMCYGMAQTLGPYGVRVNAVAPGVIDTSLVRRNFPGETFDRLVEGASARTPLKRIGQPLDVAEVVAFLLSDKAAFITGAVIPITGGIELLAPISALPRSV